MEQVEDVVDPHSAGSGVAPCTLYTGFLRNGSRDASGFFRASRRPVATGPLTISSRVGN